LVSAVHTAVGILPDLAGKPFRPMCESAVVAAIDPLIPYAETPAVTTDVAIIPRAIRLSFLSGTRTPIVLSRVSTKYELGKSQLVFVDNQPIMFEKRTFCNLLATIPTLKIYEGVG
jgi:hypothetical protein